MRHTHNKHLKPVLLLHQLELVRDLLQDLSFNAENESSLIYLAAQDKIHKAINVILQHKECLLHVDQKN